MGCKGPTTYNACSTMRWNGGVSFPIQSGHGCIGCSEDGFWDKGSFYDRLTDIKDSASRQRRQDRRRGRHRRRGDRCPRSGDAHQAPRARQGRRTVPPSQRDRPPWAYETRASSSTMSGKRVVVDPVTRIEGHMRVEVNLEQQRHPQRGVHRHHVARSGSHPEGPRSARCLGLHRTHLRRLHRHPCPDLGARGGRCAGIKIPRTRNSIRNIMQLCCRSMTTWCTSTTCTRSTGSTWSARSRPIRRRLRHWRRAFRAGR
jgi:hypothetical protein